MCWAYQEQTKIASSRVSVWTITWKRSHRLYRNRLSLRCVVHMLIPQPASQPLFTAVLYSSTVTGFCSWEESEVGKPHTSLHTGMQNMRRGRAHWHRMGTASPKLWAWDTVEYAYGQHTLKQSSCCKVSSFSFYLFLSRQRWFVYYLRKIIRWTKANC